MALPMTARVASATLSRSAVMDVEASANGICYRLKVALPAAPPPPQGYPSLIVLDGDGYFGFATDLSRNLSALGEEIQAPVVVGIGYADADPDAWHVRRALDLTPTGPGLDENTSPNVAYGGLGVFIRAFEDSLWPALIEHWPLNHHHRVLYGHSFGGLAVVHVLLTRPPDFAGYIAISPALQWNDRVVLREEAVFSTEIKRSGHVPRVFLAAGELEDLQRPERHADREWEVRRRGAVRRAQILKNTRELSQRLQSIHAEAPRQVRFLKVAGASHVAAPYAALPLALRHTFAVEGDWSATDV